MTTALLPHESLRHCRDRQPKLAHQEPRLNSNRPFLAPVRLPGLRNPDQLRQGERGECGMTLAQNPYIDECS
jgi:hypothetical protein